RATVVAARRAPAAPDPADGAAGPALSPPAGALAGPRPGAVSGGPWRPGAPWPLLFQAPDPPQYPHRRGADGGLLPHRRYPTHHRTAPLPTPPSTARACPL